MDAEDLQSGPCAYMQTLYLLSDLFYIYFGTTFFSYYKENTVLS